MRHSKCFWPVSVIILVFSLGAFTSCAREKALEEAQAPEAEAEAEAVGPEVELPEPVAQAVEANVPGAEIEVVEVAEEAGITLYDIEFKADRGEIEVAVDGTVLDIATVVTLEEIPEEAAKALKEAAEGASIQRIEKSEVRAEIAKEDEKGKLVKLETPRYVYEAELVKDGQKGEIEVAADGTVIEPLKWEEEAKKEEKSEK
ncbi:MAG: hypothetical protein ACE5LV_04355 [Candidatus Aminicenantales bacterium]